MDTLPSVPVMLQFAIATAVIAITPGPDMTLFVGRALSQGRAAGLACYLGASTGILIHTTLVALGLSALIVASPRAFMLLKLAGAGYLLWLAWQAIRHGSAFNPGKRAGDKAGLLANWATGLGINLMNPKIILFFMTFLPQFVSASDPHAPNKLFFLGAEFVLVATPIVLPMIFAADAFAAALTRSPRATRIVDWLFASVFSAFAVKILLVRSSVSL